MTDSVTVQKKQIRAEILLPNWPPSQLRLFLDPNARRQTGYERPSDLLTDSDEFLPALDKARGVVFLHRDSIMAISVSAELELDEEEERVQRLAVDQVRVLEVVVQLKDGTKLEGKMSYLLPAGQRRIQDFLNLNEPCIRIRNEDIIHIISKKQIAELSLL